MNIIQSADGYTPKNWWGNSYRGAVTPRTGIRDSMNVVAVKVMVETGIDLCYDYLLNFGFTTLENVTTQLQPLVVLQRVLHRLN